MEEQHNKHHKSYYAIIPADVRYHPKLKANCKLLYGEITALSNERGYCWAGNIYFAELYGVEPETASRWISQLKKEGFITVEIDKSAGNERKIYISDAYRLNDQYLLTKKSIPIDKKVNCNTTVNTTVDHIHNSIVFLKNLKGNQQKIVVYIFAICDKGEKAFRTNEEKLKQYQDLRDRWMKIESENDLRRESFEFFWTIYQRKEVKTVARDRWKALSWIDIYRIFHHVPKYVKATPNKEYRVLPKKYLKEKRWNDEEIVEIAAKQQDPELVENVERGNYFDRFN